MKWKKKKKFGLPDPKVGDGRTITKFLLWPMCLCGEWRWLERAAIKQYYGALEWDSLTDVPTWWGWKNGAWEG